VKNDHHTAEPFPLMRVSASKDRHKEKDIRINASSYRRRER
jgi:hypothetical protein